MPTESDGGITGVARAVARYGRPPERTVSLAVSPESLESRRRLGRKRAAEVVMVVRRKNGRYLVHTKGFYPQGVYRLLTGGIEPGEDLLKAVQRETREETGLEVSTERFLAVLHNRFVCGDEAVTFTSYLFLLQELDGVLGSHDDKESITGFREVDRTGLLALADALEALEPDWADWGRFRATAHRLAAELLADEPQG
ncbi:MAG: NUDIX hydrolase [Anaerolineae bacterium]